MTFSIQFYNAFQKANSVFSECIKLACDLTFLKCIMKENIAKDTKSTHLHANIINDLQKKKNGKGYARR